jgi:HK97 family phage major capsid protein
VDKLAYWLLRADGTATYNAITGMLNETTAAYVYSLPAGKTGFADLSAADLNKIKAKAYKRGRGPSARWIMDLEIQGVIEDLDRNGKVPVMTFGQNGSPKIKQNEVVIEEYMPGLDESAASTGFLGYGDPATFIVAMVGGMQIASDSSYLFGKNQTAFRATTIVDIKRKPVPTFILAKTAAA